VSAIGTSHGLAVTHDLPAGLDRLIGHELVDLALVLMSVALAAIALWATLHPRSSAATWVAWASRRAGGPRRLVVMLLSAIVFAAVAEDVLWPDGDDWVVMLDRQADAVGRQVNRNHPLIHEAARAISLATGTGLVAALAVASAWLVWTGRRRAAVFLLVGTAGAWLLDMACKAAFRVPRPSRAAAAAFVYGFPSGHTFVTLIAVGLLAYVCSRGLSRRGQLALYAAGLAVALVTGAARIVLHAHWLSDVVGALALGSLYLAAATAVSAHDRPHSTSPRLR